MEVRKLRPHDVFLAAPSVRMWGKDLTSESHSAYEISSLHYLPVNQTDCWNMLLPATSTSSSTCFWCTFLHLFVNRSFSFP